MQNTANPYSPVLKHLYEPQYETVYKPHQDTFLMIDALLADIDYIQARSPGICLEIGCGNGALTTTLASHIPQNQYIAIDINPEACLATQQTLSVNSGNAEIINTNLQSGLQLKEKVDVIICNPPYVVTPIEEYFAGQRGSGFEAAYAGGLRGRQFIERLLIVARNWLTADGLLYLLSLEDNGNIYGEQILSRRQGCEGLRVHRIRKSDLNPSHVQMVVFFPSHYPRAHVCKKIRDVPAQQPPYRIQSPFDYPKHPFHLSAYNPLKNTRSH